MVQTPGAASLSPGCMEARWRSQHPWADPRRARTKLRRPGYALARCLSSGRRALSRLGTGLRACPLRRGKHPPIRRRGNQVYPDFRNLVLAARRARGAGAMDLRRTRDSPAPTVDFRDQPIGATFGIPRSSRPQFRRQRSPGRSHGTECIPAQGIGTGHGQDVGKEPGRAVPDRRRGKSRSGPSRHRPGTHRFGPPPLRAGPAQGRGRPGRCPCDLPRSCDRDQALASSTSPAVTGPPRIPAWLLPPASFADLRHGASRPGGVPAPGPGWRIEAPTRARARCRRFVARQRLASA